MRFMFNSKSLGVALNYTRSRDLLDFLETSDDLIFDGDSR